MRVLVVEDEERVARALAAAIKTDGYIVDIANDGEDGWFKGSTESYSLTVLDLGLPKLDGLSVLRRWRAEGVQTPVIVLSARGTWAERVEGIDAGADDYLPKPFEMPELLARMRAIMRRTGSAPDESLAVGDLRLDLRNGTAALAGHPVSVTPLELRLLKHLLNNRGRPVSKEELADQLYDMNHERETNAIEALVSRLRRKLGNDVIVSKRGYGYLLTTVSA
jgi:two-component system, OmpR family, response regulator